MTRNKNLYIVVNIFVQISDKKKENTQNKTTGHAIFLHVRDAPSVHCLIIQLEDKLILAHF
jgi:hypothetical protein